MADLAVIYDPQLELSALVDTDTMRALGPVGIGPNSQQQLTTFVDTTPAAFLETDSYTITAAWVQFWDSHFKPAEPVSNETSVDTVVNVPDSGSNEERQAAIEAVAASAQPPAAAPHDTDMDANTGAEDQIVAPVVNPTPAGAQEPTGPHAETQECFACDGKGFVAGPTEGTTAPCNLCKGTGKIVQVVTA